MNTNIVLDNLSYVCASPILDIKSFDVLSYHSTIIGSFIDYFIYYFLSRGISSHYIYKIINIGIIQSVYYHCNINYNEFYILYFLIYIFVT